MAGSISTASTYESRAAARGFPAAPQSATLVSMGLVLLGYRGSGKTSVGAGIALRTGLPLLDLDRVITDGQGMSIRAIFESRGEAAFRDAEAASLLAALPQRAIISTGGGVVLRENNRTALLACRHPRVYLRCSAAELYRRIRADPSTAANRPALTHLGGGIEEIESLLAMREPLYRQVMSAELDVTRLCVDDVVSKIAAALADGAI